jgi:DNA processing protein
MTDKRYWLWLQMCLGEGAKFKEILEDFGSVEKLYESNILEWKMSPALNPSQIERLSKHTLKDTKKIIDECESNSWTIITYDDERYPERLREIINPPAVLYVDGSFEDFESLAAIAIVGTRKASTYALKAAHIMAKGFAHCGGAVVSGGALGVDSAAHKGALEAGGKTYAVLGCGFGTRYLDENEDLRNHIKLSGGALITEYPPHAPATKYTFPMRNRIISGLSLGVLVVEAGEKSGSLITANYAAEQNRDIFAIPASIFDSNFLGTNLLINDGAIVATSPSVLVCAYAERYKTLSAQDILSVKELAQIGEKHKENTPKSDQIAFDKMPQDRAKRVQITGRALDLPPKEKTVYEALDEELLGIEAITEKTKMNLSDVLSSLTLLEMKGLIISASGKRYKLR